MMIASNPQAQDVLARGRKVYESELRNQLERTHPGQYLVLNVDTGEYEIDRDDVAVSRRARERFPNAPLVTIRIGHPTAYRIGGHGIVKTK